MFAVLLVCCFVTVKDYSSMAKYLIALMINLLAARVLGMIYLACSSFSRIDSITKILLTSKYMYILIGIVCIMLAYTIYRISHKTDRINTDKRIILGLLGGIAVVSFVTVLILNLTGKTEGLPSILVFNDYWASERGFIWKRAVITYAQKFNFKEKFLGCGPDALYPVINMYFSEDMAAGGFMNYDNAHNEYLQYLLTTGIAGFCKY